MFRSYTITECSDICLGAGRVRRRGLSGYSLTPCLSARLEPKLTDEQLLSRGEFGVYLCDSCGTAMPPPHV